MYRDVVEVHKRARQYPSHLEYDRTSLALRGLNLGLSRKLFLRDTVASPERARTCALVWPVTTQDLAHLVRSHSKPCNGLFFNQSNFTKLTEEQATKIRDYKFKQQKTSHKKTEFKHKESK